MANGTIEDVKHHTDRKIIATFSEYHEMNPRKLCTKEIIDEMNAYKKSPAFPFSIHLIAK